MKVFRDVTPVLMSHDTEEPFQTPGSAEGPFERFSKMNSNRQVNQEEFT